MHCDVDIQVTATTDAVVAVLADESFLRDVTERAGAELTQATVSRSEHDDLTVVVRRTLPTSMIPPHARAFVGSSIEIRQVEAWSRPLEGPAGPRYGTVAAEVVGAPVQVKGTARLVPTEPGSLLTYDVEVVSTVPLVGAVVERTVADGIRAALRALEVVLAARLGTSDPNAG